MENRPLVSFFGGFDELRVAALESAKKAFADDPRYFVGARFVPDMCTVLEVFATRLVREGVFNITNSFVSSFELVEDAAKQLESLADGLRRKCSGRLCGGR